MLAHWNYLSLAWAPTASTEGQTIYLILGAVLLVLIVIGGILWDWHHHK